MESKLVKNQRKTITKTLANGNVLDIEIRYDDQCGNGHNSFAITGTLYEKLPRCDKNIIACGCIHDEIIKHAPEYAHLVKWHHMNSDGPMHYLANTIYNASDKDYNGKKAGEPSRIEKHLLIGNSPIKYKASKRLLSFIEQYKAGQVEDVLIYEKHHAPDKDNYPWKPNYCFYNDTQWHEALFHNHSEAKDFKLALETCDINIVEVVTEYSKGKDRELDSARSCAIWPEATAEELCSDNLKELLEARLPKLVSDFKEVVESLGFIY